MYIGAFISEPMYYCGTREIFHTCFFTLCGESGARVRATYDEGHCCIRGSRKTFLPPKAAPHNHWFLPFFL